MRPEPGFGGGSRLAGDNSAVATVGLVDSVAHGGGIAELDGLVAALVGGSKSKEGCDGDESLKVNK